MRADFLSVDRGFTINELMVTVLIVSILATTLGVFFVKLLTIQEQEREEGYIRERLADICGEYADFMSVGSSVGINDRGFAVKYRRETGGVSLETGRVTRAAYLQGFNTTVYSAAEERRSLDLRVLGGDLQRKFARNIMGEAALIPFDGSIKIESSITPIGAKAPAQMDEADTNLVDFAMSDAALGYLRVTAEYQIKDHGTNAARTVSAGRIVRLWNHE